jgi:hypothetical protein
MSLSFFAWISGRETTRVQGQSAVIVEALEDRRLLSEVTLSGGLVPPPEVGGRCVEYCQTPGRQTPGRPTSIRIENAHLISAHARDILTRALKEAGLTSAKITRSRVNSATQARDMLGVINNKKALREANLERAKEGKPLLADGIAYALDLYGPKGDEVIRIYEQNRRSSRQTFIRKMAEKIDELNKRFRPRGCAVTHHHEDCQAFETFDVAPSSIANPNRFEAALKTLKATGVIAKFIPPPKDPAYHIEIKRR